MRTSFFVHKKESAGSKKTAYFPYVSGMLSISDKEGEYENVIQ